jgi:uncharacterized protein involved in exopolysaccharide biosynthesis
MQPATRREQIREIEQQEAPEQDVHLLDFLIVLSKRRRFILLFTVGAAILTAVVILLIPSRYTAQTVILPPMQNSSMSSALLSQVGGSGALASMAGASLGIKNPGDMYVSLFHSRTVEDAVIQRFGLMARYKAKRASDARKQFEAHSKVVLGAKDGLITIDVWDRDPSFAAAIANGYVEEFRKLTSNLAISEAAQRRIFFQQQLLKANEDLSKAEEAMKGTQQSTGVLQIDSQTRSLIESAAALRAQVVAKEVQIQGMRTYAADDNPELLQAKEQLAALRDQLARLAGTGKGSGGDSGLDSGASFIVPKGKVPEAGMEYIRKLRDVKYYETISELISKQFEVAKLDEARQGAAVQVVDLAETPDVRSYPKRTITVLVATALAFMLACGWAFLTGQILHKKQDPATRARLDALRATFRR